MGAVFRRTVIAALCELMSCPSDTVKVMLYVPAWSLLGVHEKRPVVESRLAPLGRVPAEYVSVGLSESDPDKVNDSNWPAVTVLAPTDAREGGLSLPPVVGEVTVIDAVFETDRKPSETENTME